MSNLVVLFLLLLVLVVEAVHGFKRILGLFLLRLYLFLQNIKSKGTVNILQYLLSLKAELLILHFWEHLGDLFLLLVDHVSDDLLGTVASQGRHTHLKSNDQELLT